MSTISTFDTVKSQFCCKTVGGGIQSLIIKLMSPPNRNVIGTANVQSVR